MFVGAIVMLRQNLDPEIGRHNGAIFQVGAPCTYSMFPLSLASLKRLLRLLNFVPMRIVDHQYHVPYSGG